jgi:hypothetical protein
MTQLAPASHVPQLTVHPQPSAAVPHVLFPHASAFVSGEHSPQTPAVVPQEGMVQGVPAGQVPQRMVPPQPSDAVPQLFAPHACASVIGMQELPSMVASEAPSIEPSSEASAPASTLHP